MIETETESSWKIEEELTDGGERTLFVRIPKVEIVPPTVAIQIRRPNEPPFLTSDGWGSEAEALVPDSVVRDGGDLLLAIPSEYAVWIDDFEPIEVALEGTDVVGALPWVIEPHVKIGGDDSEDSEEINVKPTAIPHVRISTSKSMVLVGSNVELQWESENADSVAAIGDWSGDLGVSGMKEIQVSKPGENVFSLVAHGASGNGKDSVKVTGIPRWLIVLAITLVTIILLGLILWFVVKQQNPQEGTTQEGTTQEGTTQEGTTQEGTTQGNTLACSGPSGGGIARDVDQMLSCGKHEEARTKIEELTGKGDAEAALVAAEHLGARPFKPGLYNTGDDKMAFLNYRLACEGNSAAKPALEKWLQQLQLEQQTQPSERKRDLIDNRIPALLQTCGR